VLDVSLLAVGAWTTQFSVNMAMLMGAPLPKMDSRTQAPGNPLTGNYRTSDRRFIQLAMLQPTRYWPEFCRLMDCGEYVDDPRFASLASMAENADAAYDIVADAIGSRTFDECVRRLKKGTGAWAPVQDSWDVANDEALIANRRIADVVDADGHAQKLVANPVRFDDGELSLTRAPQFAEHTDEILRELGIDDEKLIELKIADAVT
jgi:crotonobetainyl-CoA:carnitine CoA-transferase CaiB-like acyl-CoA transferase